MSAITAVESTAVAGGARLQSENEFLTFKLGAEEYGIEILKVQEIRGYEKSTRIANAPAFIKGVINLRGVIVPIVDLRMKFGLDATYEAFTVTVILNVAGRTIGIVVDSVSDVLQLGSGQIRPAPEFASSAVADHITGIGSAKLGEAERTLILVDIERLMRGADMGLVQTLQ